MEQQSPLCARSPPSPCPTPWQLRPCGRTTGQGISWELLSSWLGAQLSQAGHLPFSMALFGSWGYLRPWGQSEDTPPQVLALEAAVAAGAARRRLRGSAFWGLGGKLGCTWTVGVYMGALGCVWRFEVYVEALGYMSRFGVYVKIWGLCQSLGYTWRLWGLCGG